MTCNTGASLIFNVGTSKFNCDVPKFDLPLDNLKCERHRYLYNGQCYDECPVETFRRKKGNQDCSLCLDETAGCFECDKVSAVCSTCEITHKIKTPANTCYHCNQNDIQCCDVAFGI